MSGKTGRRPRTTTHHISHGVGSSAHPNATTHSSTAAIRLSIGTDIGRAPQAVERRQRLVGPTFASLDGAGRPYHPGLTGALATTGTEGRPPQRAPTRFHSDSSPFDVSTSGS